MYTIRVRTIYIINFEKNPPLFIGIIFIILYFYVFTFIRICIYHGYLQITVVYVPYIHYKIKGLIINSAILRYEPCKYHPALLYLTRKIQIIPMSQSAV